MLRTKTVPALVLVLGLAAIAAITVFQLRADASRDAELRLADVKLELSKLQIVPFQASATTGGSPGRAGRRLSAGKQRITRTLDDLVGEGAPAELERVAEPLRENFDELDAIYAIGASGQEYGPAADRLAGEAAQNEAAITELLNAAGDEYDARAAVVIRRARIGSAIVIVLLLGGFAFLYRRAVRARSDAELLSRENQKLLAASREEALADALTGLRNRRALMNDLEAQLAASGPERRLILALYDLDGFKQYNDTFGHPAGDALLIRLAERLESAVSGRGTAYRMGGDEFCVLVPVDEQAGEDALQLAGDALTESGDAFSIGCSYGATYIPAEAQSASEALRKADQRMYQDKAERSSAGQESKDVLIKVLCERSPGLCDHLSGVAGLVEAAAERLGLSEHEVKRARLAAELHDVGKTAIPDAILNKAGKLDEQEWEFIRRHTLIGERIVKAAPSLAHTAALIRSSHERFDGQGYPDGLRGEEIPLGASIIAVCDAYDAMVSERPYHAPIEPAAALAELRRCSGTQFHPAVVECFCALVEERELVER